MDNKDNKTTEIKQVDMRYESYSLPNQKKERELLVSISENGIREPIKGVLLDGTFIVFNGFKRVRCACKLEVPIIPIEEIASNEIDGVFNILKMSNASSLHILEQAKWLNELHIIQKLDIREIANKLERSVGWVSVRLGYLREISSYIQEEVFKERFPATSAAYTLRQFKRLNKISDADLDDFVRYVSGKKLSKREVDILAEGYFKGGENTKNQIKAGKFTQIIKSKVIHSESNLSPNENQAIRNLEILQKYIRRTILHYSRLKFQSGAFKATAGLLVEGILSQLDSFKIKLGEWGKELIK